MRIKRAAELGIDRSGSAINEQRNVASYNDAGHPTEDKEEPRGASSRILPSRMREREALDDESTMKRGR